jgi:hypothetical protein
MKKQRVLQRYAPGLTLILALNLATTLSASEHRGEETTGLKLELATVPVEVLVIVSAEKPSQN